MAWLATKKQTPNIAAIQAGFGYVFFRVESGRLSSSELVSVIDSGAEKAGLRHVEFVGFVVLV